ncbi:MAG: hypothetical protein OXU61_06080 [Gammaproteobacteria bacterium]|nr:hypothetical protein [Gammaproteobacteria bacterium]
MKTNEQHPITLVTAWYKVAQRRRNESFVRPYEEWMRNLLSHIRWPLVIFCEEQSLDEIRRMRGDRPAVYFAVSPEEFVSWKYRDVFQDQFLAHPPDVDPFRALHPEVSMIQNEKFNFARRAAAMNPFGSEMIFWCDIGTFRATVRSDGQMFRLSERIEWPNLRVCRALPRHKVAITVVNYPGPPPWTPDPPWISDFWTLDRLSGKGSAPDDRPSELAVGAAFWGGSSEAVIRWGDAYYECLERRVREGRLVLTEERLMSEVCIAQPELVHLVHRSDVPWGRNTGEACWEWFRWYYLSGGKFPLGYLCGEVLLRLGNARFIKWLVLALWRGAFKINWKALWPFAGGGSGGGRDGNGRGRAA